MALNRPGPAQVTAKTGPVNPGTLHHL